MVRTAAIVPAYQEAERVTTILAVLAQTAEVDEIIVVDDGSTDGTFEQARSHSAQPIVLRHEQNRGKGAALWTGIQSTEASLLLFLDADLIGLTPNHVQSLLTPLLRGSAAMSVGVFRGGRGATTLSHRLFPGISGQRALRREALLAIPHLEKSGFGAELVLERHFYKEGLSVVHVEMSGVSHAMKEEKFGAWRGLKYRLRMYSQMAMCLLRQKSGDNRR